MPDKFGWDNNFGNNPALTRRQLQENDCPGHIASKDDAKICARCGVHIDSLRPPEDES